MSKHTPGPWQLWTGCSWRRFGSLATDTTVCEPVVAYDGHPDLLFRNGGASGPDALLIAAAPDLLEALRWALEYMQEPHVPTCGMLGKPLCRAHAAIAKAEGK